MSSRGPFQLFYACYREEWLTKNIKTEQKFREYMISEMTDAEEVRPRLFETIRTAPLEKIVAFWIRRGNDIVYNQGGYGCVSIIEGTPDDSHLDGEEDEIEISVRDREYEEECKKENEGSLTDEEKHEINSTLDTIAKTKSGKNFNKGFFVTKLREFLTMATPEKMKDQIREAIFEIA